MKTFGTQSLPSQPTQPKKLTLACYAYPCPNVDINFCSYTWMKKYQLCKNQNWYFFKWILTGDIEDTYPFRQASAQLHLIIQFPVLYTSGKVEDHVLKRQAEYIYSLQKNLQSPHVSLNITQLTEFKLIYRTFRGETKQNNSIFTLPPSPIKPGKN